MTAQWQMSHSSPFLSKNMALAGIQLTNALGENRQSALQNMFILCPSNSVIGRNFPSIFPHIHLCGMHYQWLWSNFCTCNSFVDTKAINCDNACHGPYGTSVWPCSMHRLLGVTTSRLTSQAWGGDPQQSERRPLALTKNGVFMRWAYYRELITQTTWLDLIPYCWNQSRFWAAEIP